MYARLDIGLPTHRPIAFTVLQKAFDSKGAWSNVLDTKLVNTRMHES
jgi:hypothetical protein